MDTERMIRELRRLAEKHKNDVVYTGQNNWSQMCTDVANRLEEQQKEINKLRNEIKILEKENINSIDDGK